MSAFTIIGAGPVGTLMALLLARRGLTVQVFERRSDPRIWAGEQGRSINLALAARGMAALEQAGTRSRIAAHLVAMSGRMLHEAHGELRFLPYSQNASEVIHSVGREVLNRLLIEAAAEQPSIALQFDTCCLDVDPLCGTVQLEAHGQRRSCNFDTLLAADGAHSAVRSALVRRGFTAAREEDLAHDYKELSIAARQGVGPAGYAFEPHALHIWPRGGHMLIALPNTDATFTATLFLARHGDPSFDRLRDDAAVRGFFTQGFADAAEAIVDLEQQFRLRPQGRLGSLHCERWQVDGRVLLLGDAAHAIVPFHGQGLNCGFEDCRILERLLVEQADTRRALQEFARLRRPDAAAIAAMALENYVEMRDGVRSREFAQRQALAAELEQRFPGRFIPRYSMVMFHAEIPYAEAQRRGLLQQQLLDALAQRSCSGPLDERCLAYARQWLAQHGL